MFKLRRPSVCSDLDILSDSDSVSDVTDEIQKGVSINSISESRSLGSSDVEGENQKKKRSNISSDCDGRLNESERIEADEERRGGGQEFSNSSTISNNFGSSTTTTTSPAAIMCDRKRKERHESCSQGQEKKVIRSLSHDDPKGETETDKSDFRRTQSNDDFQPKNNNNNNNNKCTSSPVDVDRETEERKLIERQQQVKPSSRNSESENNDVDASSYGVGAGATPYRPQLGLSVRHIPINFEAEAQRQWERSAQYSSNGNRKSSSSSSSRSRHRSRSAKSSVSSTPTKSRSRKEEKEEESIENAEEVTGEDIPNEDELSSPTSTSSTSSIDSLEETSDKLSCEEEIETDLVTDPNNTEGKETRGQRLGNSSSLEPLPRLDFSTLHHQVETNEPISFLQALSGIEADQVMLSPRNSSLIKECAVDPSIAPSPPLYQTVLDPPISRQHGGNQNMKMNQLSKQVSNLKRHLKALEDEHEQVFGYKPSHADKLNHKEMRKCLLQFTKAKRELKQMREDPSNVRIGGSLLQVMNSSVIQVSYPRGSPEFLKSLDDTVRKINETMSEKRKILCRPEDPTQMSPNELNEEKSAMQKQLLMLEKKHGRPLSKDEKDIVRNLYDRYRSLKKTGSRINIKESSIDLVPILEYETLELPANETDGNISTSIIELRQDSLPSSKSNSSKELKRRVSSVELDEEEEDDSVINIGNEGFTEMTLAELEERQTSARDEKRRLRSLLRKYDEKHSSPEMESIYQKYKKNRAIVRLLDVLITKRKYPLVLDKSED